MQATSIQEVGAKDLAAESPSWARLLDSSLGLFLPRVFTTHAGSEWAAANPEWRVGVLWVVCVVAGVFSKSSVYALYRRTKT